MLQQYQLLNECSGRGGRGILRFKSSLKDGVYSNLDFIIIILVIIIESYYGHPGHSCMHKVEVRTTTLEGVESRSSILILLMRNNNH
jgi:hypothetical protein